jgi:hypothetical protein
MGPDVLTALWTTGRFEIPIVSGRTDDCYRIKVGRIEEFGEPELTEVLPRQSVPAARRRSEQLHGHFRMGTYCRNRAPEEAEANLVGAVWHLGGLIL